MPHSVASSLSVLHSASDYQVTLKALVLAGGTFRGVTIVGP